MEPQINEAESVIAPLKKVTPLSKYLALALFVALPFLGGWVGYTLITDKEVKVESQVLDGVSKKVLESDDFFAETPTSEDKPEVKKESIRYGSFVKVDSKDYPIDNQLFLSSFPATSSLRAAGRNYTAAEARKISENLTLVAVHDGNPSHFYDGMVVFDMVSKQTVRVVKYPFLSLEKWISPGVQVTAQVGEHANQIVLNDYVNNQTIVLYEELDADVQLVDVCEMGCAGILHYTTDGQIIFGRHQKIKGTTATKFLGTVAIPIPTEYLSKI